jgi:hypothetical protein
VARSGRRPVRWARCSVNRALHRSSSGCSLHPSPLSQGGQATRSGASP